MSATRYSRVPAPRSTSKPTTRAGVSPGAPPPMAARHASSSAAVKREYGPASLGALRPVPPPESYMACSHAAGKTPRAKRSVNSDSAKRGRDMLMYTGEGSGEVDVEGRWRGWYGRSVSSSSAGRPRLQEGAGVGVVVGEGREGLAEGVGLFDGVQLGVRELERV